MERSAFIAKDLVVDIKSHLLLVKADQGFSARDMSRLNAVAKSSNFKQDFSFTARLLKLSFVYLLIGQLHE